MKILLSSTNPSKEKALRVALDNMGIDFFEIATFKVDSGVPSKPIGYEIIRGAENRNNALKFIANSLGIEYDYLCSIEGGVTCAEDGHPYTVTYVITEDKNGLKSTGFSTGIRITREMFRYYREGKSLNKVIERLIKANKNKESKGINGYITMDALARCDVDYQAVVSSLACLMYQDVREKIDEEITRK